MSVQIFDSIQEFRNNPPALGAIFICPVHALATETKYPWMVAEAVPSPEDNNRVEPRDLGWFPERENAICFALSYQIPGWNAGHPLVKAARSVIDAECNSDLINAINKLTIALEAMEEMPEQMFERP